MAGDATDCVAGTIYRRTGIVLTPVARYGTDDEISPAQEGSYAVESIGSVTLFIWAPTRGAPLSRSVIIPAP